MFSGFTSPCIHPAACSAASPPSTWRAIPRTSGSGSGPLSRATSRSVRPGEEEHEEASALVASGREDVDEARVHDRGARGGLGLEARERGKVVREVRVEVLDRDLEARGVRTEALGEHPVHDAARRAGAELAIEPEAEMVRTERHAGAAV